MANGSELDINAMMGVFDTHLRWNNLNGKPRGYERYHPSAFGGCLRKMQYQRYAELGYVIGKVEEFSSQTIRLFDKGHNMHSRWARYAEYIGILRGFWECSNPCCMFWDDNGKFGGEKPIYEKKPRIYGKENLIGCFKPEKCVCGWDRFHYREVSADSKELNIAGNADMIWDFSKFDPKKYGDMLKTFDVNALPKNPIVVDMKTCNDYGFKKVQKSGVDIAYRVQLIIYANILPVEYGLLIYENKNDSSVVCHKIAKSSDTIFKIIQKQAKIMNEMVKSKLLPPPKPNSKDDYDCVEKCPFSGICHKSKIWDDINFLKKRKDFYENLL